MNNKGTILYVQTSDDPEAQYSPLVLAQSAKNMGVKPIIYYLGKGLRILRPDVAGGIRVGKFPSIMDMILQVLNMKIDILACEASKHMLGWGSIDLIEGIQIVDPSTLNMLVLEATGTMWF